MERLTNIGSNGEIWITDNDETRRLGRKESAYKKLAEYEDSEEQGLLLRLPCKVRDTIWYVDDDDDNYPIEAKITRIEIKENYILYFANEKEDCGTLGFDSDDIGKTVFLTQSEAEQKLKEMESDNNGTME